MFAYVYKQKASFLWTWGMLEEPKHTVLALMHILLNTVYVFTFITIFIFLRHSGIKTK